MKLERESVVDVLHGKRVWLVHVVANALLMVAFFRWLRISDESGAWFALTVVSGLAIAFCVLLLHAGTFAYFREGSESSFVAALRRTIGKIPAFLVWTIIFGVVLWYLGQLWDYTAQAGGYAHHLLPGIGRRNVSPRSTITAAEAVVWFLFYMLWPILILPVGVQTATRGFRGFVAGRAWKPVRQIHFWITYAVCFLIGAYIPYKLAWMTPDKPTSLAAQEWSMAVRLGIGYLLLITVWLVLSAAMARATAAPEKAPVTTAQPAA